MPDQVLQRDSWDGHPVQRVIAFELRKQKGPRELHAACRLQTHVFGLELVLTVEGLLSRSQVCRSTDEILATMEQWQWRSAMLEARWRPVRDPE